MRNRHILFAAKRVPVFSLFIYVVAVYLNLPNIFKSGHSKMVLRQWQIASVQVLGMFTAKSIHVKQKECLSSLGPSTKGQVWKPRSEDIFILQNGPFGSKPHRSEETALECTRERAKWVIIWVEMQMLVPHGVREHSQLSCWVLEQNFLFFAGRIGLVAVSAKEA